MLCSQLRMFHSAAARHKSGMEKVHVEGGNRKGAWNQQKDKKQTKLPKLHLQESCRVKIPRVRETWVCSPQHASGEGNLLSIKNRCRTSERSCSTLVALDPQIQTCYSSSAVRQAVLLLLPSASGTLQMHWDWRWPGPWDSQTQKAAKLIYWSPTTNLLSHGSTTVVLWVKTHNSAFCSFTQSLVGKTKLISY